MSELDRDGWPSADTVLASERKKHAQQGAALSEIRKILKSGYTSSTQRLKIAIIMEKLDE